MISLCFPSLTSSPATLTACQSVSLPVVPSCSDICGGDYRSLSHPWRAVCHRSYFHLSDWPWKVRWEYRWMDVWRLDSCGDDHSLSPARLHWSVTGFPVEKDLLLPLKGIFFWGDDSGTLVLSILKHRCEHEVSNMVKYLDFYIRRHRLFWWK